MTHKFELRKEITLDATPEQVWDAIATGPGIDSWFMGRNEIEPREGGAGRLTMGGDTSTSTVTAWEPRRRLAYRTGEGEQVWAVLKRELGLAETIAEGDRVRLAPAGLPAIEGVVDYAGLPTFLGVRTADGLYRFIHSGPSRGNVVVLGHHVFSDDVDEKTTEHAWQTWLNELSFA